jgi:hypothetical protein
MITFYYEKYNASVPRAVGLQFAFISTSFATGIDEFNNP